MKVFVFEYVTGGGCADTTLPAFLTDADLMWRAMMLDLTAIPGVEVISLRDDRLDQPAIAGARIVATRAATYGEDFRLCLAASDAAWIVAPETGGVLERLSRTVQLAGKRLLSSRPEGARIAASKSATARHLAGYGIATVPTYSSPYLIVEDGPVVMKPDDGAGCLDTRVFDNLEAAEVWTLLHPAEDRLFQPYVAGQPRSLSLLCCDGRAQLLSVNRQHVSLEGGCLAFHGVSVDDLSDTDGCYAELAERIAAAMPGLWGHVGVDFIESAAGPLVLEVNPRLTVSYAGLRAALGLNPAQCLLDLPAFGTLRARQPKDMEPAYVE